ncbi:MAG: hypothetical protein M3119_05155 [Verrucomicrobiota bacterium]|nr:hypothetical protein [Verrucomicrobiota bacterium]MDQ6939529.1 hypothetical protein [Verrucomicrobiota bacterium]
MNRYLLRVVLASLTFLSVDSARAIVVQDVAITPAQVASISVTGFYTGSALAGINKLIVDGIAMNGFCIDPFHFSLPSSSGYQYVALASAPKLPGTMGAAKADQISRMWAMAYSPSMTASQAAGFQIAIWEIIGGSNFSIFGTDYGASALLTSLASFHGTGASLIGLSGPGQDYVVQEFRRTTAVPESGTTVVLLFAATAAIVAVAKRTRFAQT